MTDKVKRKQRVEYNEEKNDENELKNLGNNFSGNLYTNENHKKLGTVT